MGDIDDGSSSQSFSEDSQQCVIEALEIQVQELTYENIKLHKQNDELTERLKNLMNILQSKLPDTFINFF